MKYFRLALFLGLLGLIAGAFVVPFQMEMLRNTLGEAEYEKIIEATGIPAPIGIMLAALQIGILSTVLAWIGLKLTNRTGLSLPLLQTWIVEKRNLF